MSLIEELIRRGNLRQLKLALDALNDGSFLVVHPNWLRVACAYGRDAIVDFLIAYGVPAEEFFEEPFFDACHHGHTQLVARLLQLGAHPNINLGLPFFRAIFGGQVDVMRMLLEAGAPIDNAGRVKSLTTAAAYGKLGAVRFLLEKGVDVHADNDCALRRACENGFVDVVRVLLDAGADFREFFPDSVGVAAYSNNVAMVQVLLSVEKPFRDFLEDYAFASAFNGGAVEVIELLFRELPRPPVLDLNSWLSLHPFVWRRILQCVRRADVLSLPLRVRCYWYLCERYHRKFRDLLFRARARLDRPPTAPLQPSSSVSASTDAPTRDALVAQMRTAGRRFAREYWTDGIPLFFPRQQAELGPLPDEFVYPPVKAAKAPAAGKKKTGKKKTKTQTVT